MEERNADFKNIQDAKKLVDNYLKVSIAICLITALGVLILGIVYCVYGDIVGVFYIVSAIITGFFGVFMSYLTYALLMVFIDGMRDVKISGIKFDEFSEKTNNTKAYEFCSNYYLYYNEKDAYLSSNTMNGQGMRVVKEVLNALKFHSEDDAKLFAEYKKIEIGEKWKIVKKDLFLPID